MPKTSGGNNEDTVTGLPAHGSLCYKCSEGEMKINFMFLSIQKDYLRCYQAALITKASRESLVSDVPELAIRVAYPSNIYIIPAAK